eukprot:7099602-Prymnesium_polylepis.1
MNVCSQLLQLVRPRECVEVDEHVVARAQVAPQLKQPRPGSVQLLGEPSRPWVVLAAVHLDGN